MTHLIDDQLLGALLRGGLPPQPGVPVVTTGYFYVRLCQAVLATTEAAGVLSGPFAALPTELRRRAVRSLLELPDDIGLVSLRELAPVIGQLRDRHRLNILGMEVLASAVTLDAEVYLSAPSPRLEEALRQESRSVHVVS